MRRASSNLQDGLIGAWCPHITGPEGRLIRDLSGHNYHAQLYNSNSDATDWQTRKGYQGINFDLGADECADFRIGEYPFAPITLALWHHPDVISEAHYRALSVCSVTPSVSYHVLGVSFSSLRFGNNNGSDFTHMNLNATSFQNTWVHQVGVVYPDCTRDLYINGVLRVSNATTYSLGLNVGIGNIGCLRTNASSSRINEFDGMVADARVYTRALTASEVQQLYIGGPGYGLRPERRRKYFVAGAPAFKPYWSRRQSHIIGGGVS